MDAMILKILTIGLAALAERVVVVVALTMQFGLACWCMYDPDATRVIVLGLFGLTVFLPVLYRFYPKNDQVPTQPLA